LDELWYLKKKKEDINKASNQLQAKEDETTREPKETKSHTQT
jgi:hypothetical protein